MCIAGQLLPIDAQSKKHRLVECPVPATIDFKPSIGQDETVQVRLGHYYLAKVRIFPGLRQSDVCPVSFTECAWEVAAPFG